MMNFEGMMQRRQVVKMVVGKKRGSGIDDYVWLHTMTYFVQIDGLNYYETVIEGSKEIPWHPWHVTNLEERHKKAYEAANKAMALAWAINNGHCKRELAPPAPSLLDISEYAASMVVGLDWEPPANYSEQWFDEQCFPAHLFKH
jgi:hypothetical protein